MRWFYIIGLLAFSAIGFIGCSYDPHSSSSSADTEKTEEPKTDSLDWVNEEIKSDPNNAELYFIKSRLLFKQGYIQESLNELDRSISVDSTNPKYYLEKASIFYKRKQIGKASEWVDKALQKDETYVPALIQGAWIALIMKDFDQVFVLSNRALRQNIHAAEAYFIKGQAYKEEGNLRLAVTSFRTATEQDNEYYEAWVELGMMHALAKDSLATLYYNNAIRIDSTRYEALYNKGYFLQETGRYEEALRAYEAINRHVPSFYNAYYNQGFIYLEYLEDYPQAVEMFSKVVGINPLNAKAFYNRGLAYERNGETADALADYNQALQLKPDFDLPARGKTRLLEQ